MTPIIIPVLSGTWGMGPALLYLAGMVGALAYIAWQEIRARLPEKRGAGDEHIALIKKSIQSSFPNVNLKADSE